MNQKHTVSSSSSSALLWFHIKIVFFNLARRITDEWPILNEHLLAMILHPKLKKFDILIDEREKAIDLLKLEYIRYRSTVPSTFSSSRPATTAGVVNGVPSSNSINRSTRADVMAKSILSQCFDKETVPIVKPFHIEQELEDYLNRDFQLNDVITDDVDVLKFWRDQSAEFPTLALIARRIFAIPASNTTVERLFSASKNAVSERRTALGQEKLNQLMFLKKNLSLLKQLEKNDNQTVQLKRSISKTTPSIGLENNYTDDDARSPVATKPKKHRSENELEIAIFNDEQSSDSSEIQAI